MNKQQKLLRAREWKARNQEKVKAYRSQYHADHKEDQNARSAEWRKANPELYKEIKSRSDAEYRLNHREEIRLSRKKRRSKTREYERNRYRSDPQFAMVKRLRSSLNQSLKRARASKSTNTMSFVGCTASELVAHLESLFLPGMTWENRRMWHIDHILPCASFDLTDPDQQKKCYHFSNLQPLWGPQNQSKGKKIIQDQCYPHSLPESIS